MNASERRSARRALLPACTATRRRYRWRQVKKTPLLTSFPGCWPIFVWPLAERLFRDRLADTNAVRLATAAELGFAPSRAQGVSRQAWTCRCTGDSRRKDGGKTASGLRKTPALLPAALLASRRARRPCPSRAAGPLAATPQSERRSCRQAPHARYSCRSWRSWVKHALAFWFWPSVMMPSMAPRAAVR